MRRRHAWRFTRSGVAAPPSLAMVAPSWGSEDGGDTVWIRVTDSADVDSVTIGGVATTAFARASATCVRCVTGAHAVGLASVVVTGPGGTDTLANGYLYFDPTDANYAPLASYVAPEYDDVGSPIDGLWTARTGANLMTGTSPYPAATGGAPTNDGTTTNRLADAHAASVWYGTGDRHAVAVVDLVDITNDDTTNVYGNAAVYTDSDAYLGLTLYRTGAGPYTYWATIFEYDGAFRTATMNITSLVSAGGAGTLVLEGKKTGGNLMIRANGGSWTTGDACGALSNSTGTLNVGRGYGGGRIHGTIRALIMDDAARDATYSANAVSLAPRIPSGWVRRHTVGMPTAPDNYITRSATMQFKLASGRLLLVGGFNSTSSATWSTQWVTNEVWASDDEGDTWTKILAHVTDPPTSGAGARFRPCHSVAHCVRNGVAVIAGMDPTFQTTGSGDVWVSDSTGAVWTRVTTTAPCAGRTMHMMGCIGSDLYMGGGQGDTIDKTTKILDWWHSSDGGANWTQLADPPFSARGMIYSIPEIDGKLYLTGGSVYDNTSPLVYNGVYSFDGTTWVEILPDGHAQWTASQYSVPCVLHGRIWLFNGYDAGTTADLYRPLYSDDKGATWSSFVGGSGGDASHADYAMASNTRVVRIPGFSSGTELGRPIYTFELEGATP